MNRSSIFPIFFLAAVMAVPHAVYGENKYLQHNLTSDIPGVADHVDPNLVNPWGMAASPASPMWVANNRTGIAAVYDGSGKPAPLTVSIPSGTGGNPSAPTGQVFNSTTGFVLRGVKPATFLFCTEDGVISGWYNGIDRNVAVTAVNNSSSGAVYKGLAAGTSDSGPVLYAANFAKGSVDVFGADFAPKSLPGSFNDPSIPAGFAPFNIYTTANEVYVAYARQDEAREDDVPGNGNGFITVFDMNGVLVRRLVAGGRLNSPWGMVVAPNGFGDFSGALLVGNFGDGTINAYSPSTGQYLGTLQGTTGKPIVNTGLWALQFGNGKSGGDATTLYFTAGISGPATEAVESHGLFGSIQAAPLLTDDQVLNAAGFQKNIAANTWVAIFGANLAATTRSWQSSDFKDNRLPTQLDGVTVTIGGKPAYISYVSPTQINVLTPASLTTGDLAVQTNNGELASNSTVVRSDVVSPAMFLLDAAHALALHADNTLVVSDKPALPGEVIVFYGTGFGATDPAVPEGTLVTAPAAVVRPAAILIGGMPADILFQGLTSTGIYQFNVRVPAGVVTGDASVVALTSGVQSPDGIAIAINAPQPPPPPTEYAAQISNFQFAPNPINATVEGTLKWTNKDAVGHTVTSDTGQFKSGVLGAEDTFSFTPSAPGTYSYHCSIHPFMKGQIVVK